MFKDSSLHFAEEKAKFKASLQSRLEDSCVPTFSSLETLEEELIIGILQISVEVPGFSSKKNKDWFDENNEEIQELMMKKRLTP